MSTVEKIRFEIENLIPDHTSEKVLHDAKTIFGLEIDHIHKTGFYLVEAANTDRDTLIATGEKVFIDPLIQILRYEDKQKDTPLSENTYIIEITFRPGVTDNPAASAEDAFRLIGVPADISSGHLYTLRGDIQKNDVENIAHELMANTLIQKIDVYTAQDFENRNRFKNINRPMVMLEDAPKVETIQLNQSDDALMQISDTHCLALSLDEIHHIQDQYKNNSDVARRKKHKLPTHDATDVELEIIAQSWSEHCKHKIFSAAIAYTDENGTTENINSLYRTYIKGATKKIAKDGKADWLISVFEDNAGIVRFDDTIDLCIKAETHNSPSALDPYGGALTGILGVNRDILGCGLGARPIANTDVFCFADPKMPEKGQEKDMPAKLKPPKRIFEGVHLGVEDGGNKSGIPTVNGAIFFDRDYAGKPLVFCGTVGVMPQTLSNGLSASEKYAKPGDRVFVVGGGIGADGIHGATFSSMELNENAPATAVQIGDPLTQKRVSEFLIEARDLGLFSSITDNGAGGLSSSVGEMALQPGGAEIDLGKCPVKYPGLHPYELMISESQERMTFAVPTQHCEAMMSLAEKHGVVATDIGVFTDDGYFHVLYHGKCVADLDLKFLHDSLPPMRLNAVWDAPRMPANWKKSVPLPNTKKDIAGHVDNGFLKESLLTLLSRPNIASKEKWVRRYDHEVQAATHIKPFVGKESDGPGNSGVIWLAPHGGKNTAAIAIGCGLAPRISHHDPYKMAQYAVDEAMRNVVVSGGDPDTCCLLDNFCWPDPVQSDKTPDGDYKLGQLVKTCQGLYDICTTYGAPLVSGKDSMKNDYRGKDHHGDEIVISVPPTLLVTAMAKANIHHTVDSAFKNTGDLIYILGKSNTGLTASEFAEIYNIRAEENTVPEIDCTANQDLYRAYHTACQNTILSSGHDLSDGGLAVALAESMIGGRLGADIDITPIPDSTIIDLLFGEASGRFLVSIPPQHQAVFEDHFRGHFPYFLGYVRDHDVLNIKTPAEKKPLTLNLNDLVTTWKNGLSL